MGDRPIQKNSKAARLLTPTAAAMYLSVSMPTLRRLVAAGRLKRVKLRSQYRYDIRDLEQFIADNKGDATDG